MPLSPYVQGANKQRQQRIGVFMHLLKTPVLEWHATRLVYTSVEFKKLPTHATGNLSDCVCNSHIVREYKQY